MAGIKFKVKFPKLKLDTAEEQKKVDLAYRLTMQSAVEDVTSGVLDNTPRGASGNLFLGIENEVMGDTLKIRGHVFTNVPYGIYVEEGTQPFHLPPFGPIFMWVQRVLSGGEDGDPIKATEGVRWKIYHYGTKGQWMFKKGWKAKKEKVTEKFKAVGKIIAAKFGK